MACPNPRRHDLEGHDGSRAPAITDSTRIGCGNGFDDDLGLQARVAEHTGRLIGVEPNQDMVPAPVLDDFFGCRFEDAPIRSSTVDIALAVMVLEHVDSPEHFWTRLHDVLRDGGICWGFTIDARNWFAKASTLREKAGIKGCYLNRFVGTEDHDRYVNYPVHYIPRPLRWAGRRIDRYILARGLPGTLMAVRLVK